MRNDQPLYELLYVSAISPGAALNVVGQIARGARAKNLQFGITGLLLFDGESFCQHLEGNGGSVQDLFDRIKVDVRHHSVVVLDQGSSAKRRFRRFSMGYANVEGAGSLKSLAQYEGQDARSAFSELLTSVDMEP